MKRTIFFLGCLLCVLAALAQVKVTVQAPAQTEEGQRIRVSYVVNTQDVDDIQVGDFPGFELLFGPTTSSSSSFSMINGKTTHSSQMTFSYTLLAQKAGSYKLPVATVKSDGKSYKSNQVSIEVLEGNGNSNGNGNANGNSGGATRMRTQEAGDRITANDLYITVTASKKRLYEQEAVLLTYKLYTLVSIDQCMGKMPDLDGFHTQEIELPQQKTLKYERMNGKNYGTVVWSQYVLFPQKTGKLTVPAINFEAEVVQQNRSIDPFDAFFNGGSSLVRVKKTIVAPAVELQVEPLPTKPANFSGAVGSQFNISGTLSPEQVDANDAVQLRLVVSGVGNMKLMKAPTVQWPKDFETYDPKVTDKTKVGVNGASGNVVYDYTAVPRHGGKYAIPPVEFCYFDTKTNSYKTIRTDSFHVAVAKGVGNGIQRIRNQEDLTVLNSDIRYIKTGDVSLNPKGSSFFGSTGYWLYYLGALLVFLLMVAVFYRQAKANANVARRRGKKAGKAAGKRLKQASKLLKQGEANAFYDEVTRALWGYVGDKLNLPVAELNKDNVGEQLSLRGVDETLTKRFLDVLSDCEFARYAPGEQSATMDKLYNDAAEVINELDGRL
ncbi:MAG: protein BatD [Bacteroidaceae bacterium]|nr:protein BatD [Bacteroidaceae bacterium]